MRKREKEKEAELLASESSPHDCPVKGHVSGTPFSAKLNDKDLTNCGSQSTVFGISSGPLFSVDWVGIALRCDEVSRGGRFLLRSALRSSAKLFVSIDLSFRINDVVTSSQYPRNNPNISDHKNSQLCEPT